MAENGQDSPRLTKFEYRNKMQGLEKEASELLNEWFNYEDDDEIPEDERQIHEKLVTEMNLLKSEYPEYSTQSSMGLDYPEGAPDRYHPDTPFADPIVRCTECQHLLLRGGIKKYGYCVHCGCRKVRKVQTMREEESHWCKKNNIDPEFLALFQEIDEDTNEPIRNESME